MGFLTREQLRELHALAHNLRVAKGMLQKKVIEHDGQNLHSQACPIGGLFTGAHNGVSGETPCPCGAQDPQEVTVTIKMRPPCANKGERGWEVPIDIEDPLEALSLVVRESGERMLGYDNPLPASSPSRGMREITVIITNLIEA
jgi:hypothetical protein